MDDRRKEGAAVHLGVEPVIGIPELPGGYHTPARREQVSADLRRILCPDPDECPDRKQNRYDSQLPEPKDARHYKEDEHTELG